MGNNFEPRARLLLQLGDQLIRNESIALIELIKNSYDADATNVNICIKNSDDLKKGEIIIEDNGFGMSSDIIKTVWLEPGNDHKEKQFKEKKVSPKYGRLPLGEKGIGRFGVHKLGRKVEIVSKMNGEKEVYFSIDWNTFKTSEYLKDVPITIQERKPEYFINRTGTLIKINGLNSILDKNKIRDIYRNILTLNSPFKKIAKFNVNFKIDKEDWLKDLMTYDTIRELSLFNARLVIEGSSITSFVYNYIPHKNLTKVDQRNIEYNEPFIMEIIDKKNKTDVKKIIDLSNFKIGKITLEVIIFDRDTTILNQILGKEKRNFKNYLDANGGIKVFRDGIRVYDYGEPGNDWLELDAKRINAPGEKISNNIVIGSVEIRRADSEDLIEKTNREGFIETEAYEVFKKAVQFAIRKIEIERNADKSILREMYGTINIKEPVKDNLKKLKEKIEENIDDGALKDDLLSRVKQIDEEYQYLTDIFIHSGGSNNNLRIGLHEIEKIISELNYEVLNNFDSVKIKEIALYLKDMVKKYFEMNTVEKPKAENIVGLINTSKKYLDYRFKAHNVNISFLFDDVDKKFTVECVKNLVISSIINIFDNSIYWLEKYKIKNKKIHITTVSYYQDYLSFLIADNGKGIRLPKEAITKPFITGKEEGGMGMGLNIVSEIMKMHNGILDFPEFNEFKGIPDDFKNGAIVMLSFKKGGI